MKFHTAITEKDLDQAVACSCALEGISFEEAKKNKELIRKLKEVGRAFDF